MWVNLLFVPFILSLFWFMLISVQQEHRVLPLAEQVIVCLYQLFERLWAHIWRQSDKKKSVFNSSFFSYTATDSTEIKLRVKFINIRLTGIENNKSKLLQTFFIDGRVAGTESPVTDGWICPKPYTHGVACWL